jgi:hypothetical protein
MKVLKNPGRRLVVRPLYEGLGETIGFIIVELHGRMLHEEGGRAG